MSKRLSMLFTAIVLVAVLVMSPGITAFASVADGTYEVNYEMKEAKSENTSIADGYFSKPATLRVENGVKTIQITVTGADMIKELTAPSGPVQVVSEDPNNDTRVVKFRVDGDLADPVSMKMHIVVPDLYDMEHTARAVFDVSNLPEAGSGEGSTETGTETENETNTESNQEKEEEIDNPQTGDDTPIALYVSLLVASVAIFTVYKVRFSNQEG